MRLLVTGASGQVGWELSRSLMPLGEVVALDHRQCDFSRPELLPSLIRSIKPSSRLRGRHSSNDSGGLEENSLLNGTGNFCEVTGKLNARTGNLNRV